MAKQRSRNTYARRGRARTSSSLAGVWLLLGILLGVGMMGVAYLFYNPSPATSFKANQSNPGNVSSNAPQLEKNTRGKNNRTAKNLKENQNQRFEFYRLLPGMEIELPDTAVSSETTRPTRPTPTPIAVAAENVNSAKTTTKENTAKPKALAPVTVNVPDASLASPKPAAKSAAHYIVQAGIFQALPEADTFKAQLALQGFAPNIQKVQTQDGHAWFRVTLGPFGSEALALNQKKSLEAQKIHGILILQRPNERNKP